MTLIMQVYAHCSKKFRNYACAFYIKFGKNTSITMQQTSIWQKKTWVSELVMHMLRLQWKEVWVCSNRIQAP